MIYAKLKEPDMGKRIVNIYKGARLHFNGHDIKITKVFKDVGFYYRIKGSKKELFCNTVFETINFEPVYKEE